VPDGSRLREGSGRNAGLIPAAGAGDTPVVSAVHSNQVGARKILIAAKADVNIPDNSGKTSLFYAKLSGNEEVIALLAAAGASE
jgi:ankyrin repeat protein